MGVASPFLSQKPNLLGNKYTGGVGCIMSIITITITITILIIWRKLMLITGRKTIFFPS